MSQEEIKKIINQALDSLISKHFDLLDLGVTERALSHHLAIELTPYFPGYDVDVEYNRKGVDPKRLNLPQRKTLEDDIRATTVFPDIIVHKRNTPINLLVIEMKKNEQDIGYDEHKLKAFRKELGYKHAAHVIISRSGENIPRMVIFVDSE
jgi:transposase